MPKLTQKMIDITPAPATGQLFLRDELLKGFGVRITPQKRTYIVDSRVNGTKRRITIGRCDLISLDDARSAAIKLLGEMASGHDPTAQKRNEKIASITLIELLEEYLQVRYLKKSSISSLFSRLFHRLQTVSPDRVPRTVRSQRQEFRKQCEIDKWWPNLSAKTKRRRLVIVFFVDSSS